MQVCRSACLEHGCKLRVALQRPITAFPQRRWVLVKQKLGGACCVTRQLWLICNVKWNARTIAIVALRYEPTQASFASFLIHPGQRLDVIAPCQLCKEPRLTHRSLGLLLALFSILLLCPAQGGTAPVLQRCSVPS